MAQTDSLAGVPSREAQGYCSAAPQTAPPPLAALKSPTPDAVPFAVDVLFVGHATRTIARLAAALRSVEN